MALRRRSATGTAQTGGVVRNAAYSATSRPVEGAELERHRNLWDRRAGDRGRDGSQ
jgi:hypothetical protein